MKATTIFFLIALLLTLPSALTRSAVTAETPLVYLDPPVISGVSEGETFVVTVQIDAFVGLYAWAIDVSWDPAVLDFVDATEGTCLASNGTTFFLIDTVSAGSITGMMCTLFGDPDVYFVNVPPGPDDFVALEFQVVQRVSESSITIDVTLVDTAAVGHYPDVHGATIQWQTYMLTINVVGSGVVNPNVTAPYYDGDVVELTAVPGLGWSFSLWSVDLSGSANPVTIVMDGDKTVNATFVPVATFIPLSGWSVDPRYTNASYVLDSSESSLFLQLDATDTSSKVTIRHLSVSQLSLSDSTYVDVACSGTANARVLLRFFLDDGSSFTQVYWTDPATLNAVTFGLAPYAGRILRGDVYLGLMSADGTVSNVTITGIAFVEEALPPLIPLSGWEMDSRYTNEDYVLNSSESNLFIQLNATDLASKVTIRHLSVQQLSLSDYAYVDVACSGTANARVLLRFFLDDGSSLNVVYWKNAATLNATAFDLSPYAGRILRGDVYLGLMSADGTVSNVTITGIAFVEEALPPLIPLSGWEMDPRYTNASYVLDSSESSLYLQLDATDTSSKVTIRHLDVPKLHLSDYTYVDVTCSGTANARILLRFFLDDGSCFDIVYWKDTATLNATAFDLSPYAGRTLRGDVYVGLMSSDGTQANVTITQIAFVQP